MTRQAGVITPRWRSGTSHSGAASAGGGGSGGATSDRTEGGGAITTTLRADAISVSGALPLTFGYVDLAASQTNLQAYQMVPGSASIAAQLAEQQWFRGSILGLRYRSTGSITAGTATLDVIVDTEEQGIDLAIETTRGFATFSKGQYPFAAGEDLYPVVTTSSTFAPATLDLIITVLVSYEPE